MPLNLKVLIVYEDFQTGLRARRSLDDIMQQLPGEADMQIVLWRWDLLVKPVLRQEAMKEASEADILFVSAHNLGEFTAIKMWLEEALARRGGEPCALAISLGSTAKDSASGTYALRQLAVSARHAGVEVFLEAEEKDATDHAENRMAVPEEVLLHTERHRFRDSGRW